MNGTAIRDRIFKTVILAFLIFSILIQILVSAWFYDKLKMLENRLSLHPVNKPVEVDLRVTIPELVEIDRKIDRLTQRVGNVLRTPREAAVLQRSTKSESPSKSVKKKPKLRESTKSTQVDVVEKIGN